MFSYLLYYISGTAEATNFKFCRPIDYKEYIQKMQNQGTKGRGLNDATYFSTFQFLDPIHIFGTAKATNFKFELQIDYDC